MKNISNNVMIIIIKYYLFMINIEKVIIKREIK